MKHFMVSAVLSLVLVAPVWSTAPAVAQQKSSTIGVLSIASVDKALGDVGLLAELSDNSAILKEFRKQAEPFLAVIDTSQPAGVMLRTDGDEKFWAVGFAPISDIKKLVAMAEAADVDIDLADGIYSATGPNGKTINAKSQGDWLFIAEKKSQLKNLPKNPAKLLGSLPKKYIVAAQLNIQAIPADLRDKALAMLDEQISAVQQPLPGENDEDFKARMEIFEEQMDSIRTLVKEIDKVTFGWAVNKKAKSTYFDIAITAVPGSDTAKTLSIYKNATSAHSGFLLPGAALTMHFSSSMPKQEIQQSLKMLEFARKQILEKFDEGAPLPDEKSKERAAKVIAKLLDLFIDTVKEGKIDGGLAVVLKPRDSSIVAGGRIADGGSLDKAFREFVALAKELDDDFPDVEFEAESYQGVTFHTLSIPLDEDDKAAKVFGEKLNVAFGTGKKSFYVAFGKDALGSVKQVIDLSKKNADQKLPPAQMALAIGPIVKFAASVDEENPALLMASILVSQVKDKDHVRFVVRPIKNGFSYRIELEEGLVRIIGQAGKFAKQLGGGPGL